MNIQELITKETLMGSNKETWSQSRLWSIKEDFADVTISCFGKKNIFGHKIILSASSPLLHRLCLLSSEVSLSEAPIKTVENLLKFIYTGQVPTDRDLYNDFFVLAKNLDVQDLPTANSLKNQSGSSDGQPGLNGARKRKQFLSDSEQPLSKRSKSPAEDSDSVVKSVPEVSNIKLALEVSKLKSTPEASMNHSKNGITRLPNEILLKIFSYVETNDLVKQVSLVSKRFNHLSKDPSAYVSLHLNGQENFTSGKFDFKKTQEFLAGKDRIQEVHIPYIYDRSNLNDFMERTILQQKFTRVIDSNYIEEVLKLLKEHPEKARKLEKLVFGKSGVHTNYNVVIPHLKTLTHLRVDHDSGKIDIDQFMSSVRYGTEDLLCLMKQALISRRFESLSTTIRSKHLQFFVPFLEANQHSLRELRLPNYDCSTTDFVQMTSLCSNLQVVDLNCKKVSEKNLLKIADLKNISDLKIRVSDKCASPELLSACLASPNVNVMVCQQYGDAICTIRNSTEFELRVDCWFIPAQDLSKFLFPQITKLKLKTCESRIEDYPAIEKLKNLTELSVEGNKEFSDVLKLLDLAERMQLKKFQTNFSGFDMSYESKSFNLINDIFRPKEMSEILKRIEILSPEKLSLTNNGSYFPDSALQSLLRLKHLSQIHLSFFDFQNTDGTAKTLFERLPRLELLIVEVTIGNVAPDVIYLSPNEVTCNMNEHLLKIQRGKSEIFFSKKCIKFFDP